MKNRFLKKMSNSFEKINHELLKNIVPGEVCYFETTKSTNLDAKHAQNVPDKSLFIAEMQEAGRGRLGREWSSPPGDGIWMSILLQPEIPIKDISQLTLLAGIAVSRVIPDSSIKWPNDVLLSGKKVSGILTESVAENGKISRVIVGIGINVNTKKFPEELADKATSVFLETHKDADRTELARAVLAEFFELYDVFLRLGFDAIHSEYAKKCITLGREVVIINGDNKKTAKAVGITDCGELIIETENTREIVNSGEVSVRGLLGYN